jgi:hypothetical protein
MQLLKRAGVETAIRARTFAGMADQIRTGAGEAGNFRAPPCAETSVESYTVNGVPLMNVIIPFACQPPSTCAYHFFAWRKNGSDLLIEVKLNFTVQFNDRARRNSDRNRSRKLSAIA